MYIMYESAGLFVSHPHNPKLFLAVPPKKTRPFCQIL